MKPIKSLVSFVRKQTGVKGSSEHTGRGSWLLFGETTLNVDQWDRLIEKWKEKGLIESVETHDNGSKNIVFKSSVFENTNEFYREVVTRPTGLDQPLRLRDLMCAVLFVVPEQRRF